MAEEPARRIMPTALTEFGSALFQEAGASADHASALAETMVWASARGVDSHGITRFPRYVELLQKGDANPQPDIEIKQTKPGVALIEADRAPGPVALRQAADLAVEMAETNGIASVAVQKTVHTLAIGSYTSRIAESGLVGIAFVAGMPNMAYTGVRGAAVATSPLSIAVPSRNHATVLLDMATATVALGKIRQHKASGTPLPEGVAATADSVPTTDPEEATMPLPLGGPKGSGMSLVFELITSVLVGAPIVEEVHNETGEGRRHRQNALIIALDPGAFGDPGEFKDHVDATLDALKGLPVAEGSEGIFFPGERSSAVAAERLENGIPIKPKLWGSLSEVADLLQVNLPTE